MLQKSSTLIGQLATVHNCDWLIKDKQIYKLSSIIFMDTIQNEFSIFMNYILEKDIMFVSVLILEQLNC